MHAVGARFGIYSDVGTRTCGGFLGSEGHETIDAETFAAWGVDYLKLDGCYSNITGYERGYPTMGAALQKTKRDIVYSCSWPAYLGIRNTPHVSRTEPYTELSRRLACCALRQKGDVP